ncbi:MAG: hypothetical protein KatS3mg114_0249 [Planctomycetaceae bacterium]|nr:MAG: hypothetical protein KatS3mg114_0249 [Planctomycetaceae bacterium]
MNRTKPGWLWKWSCGALIISQVVVASVRGEEGGKTSRSAPRAAERASTRENRTPRSDTGGNAPRAPSAPPAAPRVETPRRSEAPPMANQPSRVGRPPIEVDRSPRISPRANPGQNPSPPRIEERTPRVPRNAGPNPSSPSELNPPSLPRITPGQRNPQMNPPGSDGPLPSPQTPRRQLPNRNDQPNQNEQPNRRPGQPRIDLPTPPIQLPGPQEPNVNNPRRGPQLPSAPGTPDDRPGANRPDRGGREDRPERTPRTPDTRPNPPNVRPEVPNVPNLPEDNNRRPSNPPGLPADRVRNVPTDRVPQLPNNPRQGERRERTEERPSSPGPRGRDATQPGITIPELKLDPDVQRRIEEARRGRQRREEPSDPEGGSRREGVERPREIRLPSEDPASGERRRGGRDDTDGRGGGAEGGDRIRLDLDRMRERARDGLPVFAGVDPGGRVIRQRIDRNGLVDDVTRHPDLSREWERLREVRRPEQLEDLLGRLRSNPDFGRTGLGRIDIDRLPVRFARHWEDGRYDRLFMTPVGRNLLLSDQFALYIRGGDVARQMNLHLALLSGGGWSSRFMGRVSPRFTTMAFSIWYPGPGFYPRWCWMPRWSPWVRWSWWDWCWPIYDPRPWICRPRWFAPCPVWVWYEVPVFTPLPVVTCGTWVDYRPVVVPSGFDLQLVAVRFVDPGHPEENLGPRYRVWLSNNSAAGIGAPFHVMLLASNTPSLSAGTFEQAGVTVDTLDAGELISVDIRLPAAANKMQLLPDGHRVPFNYLHVLVDSHRQVAEDNEANNGTVLLRNDVLPVDPAAFSTDATAASPGTLVSVAGEGFGPEPGQVIVTVGDQARQAEIHGWYELGVYFEVPSFALSGPTDAEVLVIRGDGAASNPLTLTLAPGTVLMEAPMPPPPSP